MENKNVKILETNIGQEYIDYMFNNVISVIFSDIISTDTYNIELKKKNRCIIDYFINNMKKESVYDIEFSIYKYDAKIFSKETLLSKYFDFDEKYYDVFYFFILKKEKLCELNYFFLIICKKNVLLEDSVIKIKELDTKGVQNETTIIELRNLLNDKNVQYDNIVKELQDKNIQYDEIVAELKIKNDLIYKLINELKDKNSSIENSINELKLKNSSISSSLNDISISLKYIL